MEAIKTAVATYEFKSAIIEQFTDKDNNSVDFAVCKLGKLWNRNQQTVCFFDEASIGMIKNAIEKDTVMKLPAVSGYLYTADVVLHNKKRADGTFILDPETNKPVVYDRQQVFCLEDEDGPRVLANMVRKMVKTRRWEVVDVQTSTQSDDEPII